MSPVLNSAVGHPSCAEVKMCPLKFLMMWAVVFLHLFSQEIAINTWSFHQKHFYVILTFVPSRSVRWGFICCQQISTERKPNQPAPHSTTVDGWMKALLPLEEFAVRETATATIWPLYFWILSRTEGRNALNWCKEKKCTNSLIRVCSLRCWWNG